LGGSAPSLRMALARDLDATERRLANMTAASLADSDGVRPGKLRLQRSAADLDRLEDTIGAAVASIDPGAGPARDLPRDMPRDLNEAYATLGVNAGAPEGTVKKLVDALRVSWHPDLATSAADRQLRDRKIREINVAWELIAGKRVGQ
jgi:hypothetical protein